MAAAMLGVLGGGVASAEGATRWVDDDHAQCPTAAFTAIQPAIDASAAGDAVVVCDGTYPGRVVIGPSKDRLRLTSQNTEGATITDEGSAGGGDVVHVGGAQDVLVLKFHIRFGDFFGCPRFGIRVTGGGSALIRSNVLSGTASAVCDDFPGRLPQKLAGVDVDGAHATVLANRFAFLIGAGVNVHGDDAFAHISKNDISIGVNGIGESGVGVALDGAPGEVLANRIAGAPTPEGAGAGIVMRGHDGRHRTRVRVNSLSFAGLAVDGWNGSNDRVPDRWADHDLVEANRFSDGGNNAVLSVDDTEGLVVSRNVFHDMDLGIHVFGGSHDNLISGNDARDVSFAACRESTTFFGPPVTTLRNTWFHNQGSAGVEPAGICR